VGDAQELEFPGLHWEELCAAMQAGGADAVARFVRDLDDVDQRLQLWSFAGGAFANRDWEGKDLDRVAAVFQAAIADILELEQAARASDAERADELLDRANVLSYNLAASLAECWPGDPLPRASHHFELGLKAAEDCLRWRVQLNKGPFPFSIAWWARGMHQLSLGERSGAVESFERALESGARFACEQLERDDVGIHESFAIAIGEGYLGIARHLLEVDAGQGQAGRAQYERACAGFGAMAEVEEQKADAEFGLAQLEHVWARLVEARV